MARRRVVEALPQEADAAELERIVAYMVRNVTRVAWDPEPGWWREWIAAGVAAGRGGGSCEERMARIAQVAADYDMTWWFDAALARAKRSRLPY